ncbi:MAG: tetratricopeptide repeat protein [Elusimicrobiaceae bacterium]|nr:tetratricopeptide repeat protein [Elusimicrobiaceae bacterium]
MKKIGYIILGICSLCACTTLPTSSEYLLRGDGYFKDGKAKQAIAAYNRAIALNPENLEAYASRGSVHFFQGNYDLAQQDFEHVLSKNPYQADAYTAYGSVLAARGSYQNALKVLEIAIQLQPEKPENFFSRAGIYFMLGKFREAVADYTAVINLYPAADVYNARGAAYLNWGKKDLAEKDFETAKNGKMPATLNVYSMIK